MLEQIGLDVDAVRAIRPDVVMVRMPGFGLDGPWRDNPAFAFVIEDAAGLTWMTGYPDDNPVSPYCVGDSNAGTARARAACSSRWSTAGAPVRASSSRPPMVDAAAQRRRRADRRALGLRRAARAGRQPRADRPPRRTSTSSADTDDDGGRDAWVAIAVATDEQWLALRDALGRPGVGDGPGLATAAGRRAQHDAIDDHLSTWCGERSGDEIVDCLWGAGVPVAKVMQPHEQADAAASCSPAASSRTSTARSGPARPAQHAADPVLRAARPGSTAAPRRCSASTPTRCSATSG